MIGLKEPPDRPQMTAKRERSTFKKRGHLRQTSGLPARSVMGASKVSGKMNAAPVLAAAADDSIEEGDKCRTKTQFCSYFAPASLLHLPVTITRTS